MYEISMSPLCIDRDGDILLYPCPLSLSESVLWVCPQKTRHIYPLFDQCWPNVVDGGQTLVKHWVDVSCLLGLTFISLQRFLSCRRSNTRLRLNAGLMLAHRLRRWPSISPVLGYRVVFGASVNVGQRHSRRANINSALVQSIVPVLPACRYRQHEHWWSTN